MKKSGEDQPPKQAASMKQLARLANEHPKADQDTSYQDNKGRGKEGVKKDTRNNKRATGS